MKKCFSMLLMALGMLLSGIPAVAQSDTDIATGYYYVYKSESQALVNINSMMKWDPLQRGNAAYIFHLEKADSGEDEYYMQCLVDDTWWGLVTYWGTAGFMDESEKSTMRFVPRSGGAYGIRPSWTRPDLTGDNEKYNFFQTSNSGKSAFSGTTSDYHNLAQWDGNDWYVEKVPDNELATAKLRLTLIKAIDTYRETYTYTVSTEGLLTKADASDNLGTGSQFFTTCQEATDDNSSFANLIDGDNSTYFQSTWKADQANAPQWLQVDAGKQLSAFQLKIGLRDGDWGSAEMWQDVTLYATNDEAAATNAEIATIDDVKANAAWTRIGEYNFDIDQCMEYGTGEWGHKMLKAISENTDRYMTKDIVLNGGKYRYLRFYVNQTMNPQSDNKDYTLGEFQIYEITDLNVDETLETKSSNLKSLIKKSERLITSLNATEADITALEAAMNEEPEVVDGIKTGYYYIYKDESQAIVNINSMMKWDPLQRGNAAYIFHLKKAETGDDEYYVQCLVDNTWWGLVTYWGTAGFMDESEKSTLRFVPREGDAYGIRPSWTRPDLTGDNEKYNFFQTSNSGKTAFSGTTSDYHNLAQWDGNDWYIERVPEYELIAAKQRLALKDAINAYQDAFSYTIETEGLLTDAEADDPATGEGSQFLTTCQTPDDYSSFANLIDGDLTTCFQSTWDGSLASAPQWLQVDARKAVEGFQLKIGLRDGDWGSAEMWQDITLFATNDESAATDISKTTIDDVMADPAWVRIGEYDFPTDQCMEYGTGEWGHKMLKAIKANTGRYMTKDFLLLGGKYRYLRFFVNQTMNPQSDNKDFTLGELQIYEITNPAAASTKADLANTLKDLIEKTKQQIANLSGTEDDLDALIDATETMANMASPALADLQNLVDSVKANTPKLIIGTNPGYNDEELVNAYQTALENAQTATHQDLSEAEYTAAASALRIAHEAVKNSVIPVTDGYYYFYSAFPNFFNTQGVNKAIYANYEGTLSWGTFDAESASQLFKVTSLGDGTYSILNMGTDTYIGTVAGSGKEVPTTATQEVGQIFKHLEGTTQFNIYNTQNSTAYYAEAYDNGGRLGGAILTANGGANTCSAWNLIKVTDEELIEHLINDVAPQNKLNYQATQELSASQIVYEQMFRYKVDYNKGLITDADSDDPATGEGSQFFSTCQVNDSYTSFTHLIDGDHNTCFQSSWSSSVVPPQWLQVDLRNNPVQDFQFYFGLRDGMWGAVEQWTDITVYATNDENIAMDANIKQLSQVEELSEWTKIGDYLLPIDQARDDRNGSNRGFYYNINRMDQKYRFIRFFVNSTYEPQTNMMFTIGEFQMYENTLDEERSPYTYVDGLKDLADQLYDAMTAIKPAIDEGNVTQEMIDKIVAAREAMVALVPNTASLDALIAEVSDYVDLFNVGTNYGDVTSEQWSTINKAIDDAADYGDHPLKVELEERYAALEKAYATFKSQQKQFDPNKWYFIVNQDKTAIGSYVDGTESTNIYDTFTYGNVFYATSDNTIAAGSWGEGNKNAIHWGYFERSSADKDNTNGVAIYRELTDPHTMWRFVPIEGKEGQFAIQNRASGKYLVNYTGDTHTWLYQVDEPMPYTLENFASGQYGIIPPEANQYLQLAGDGYLYSWSDQNGKANQRWAWTLEPVEDDDFEFFQLQFPENSIQVVSLPYALDDEDLSDYNAEVGLVMYGIDGIHNGDDGSQELYLKQIMTAEAGEPFILVAGDYEQYDADDATTALFAVPLMSEYTTESGKAEGLVGALDYTKVPRAGLGVFVNSELKASTEGQGVDAHTGYIDIKNLAEATGNPDLILTLAEGITSVKSLTGAVKADDVVNVYTIDGKLVKKNVKAADAKKDLKKGVYIVGKKKIAVK